METVTISKKELNKLVLKAKAYDMLAKNFFKNKVNDPVDIVVNDFKNANLYSDKFIIDLEDGLNKSSYNNLKTN
jgi:hypothetical protein